MKILIENYNSLYSTEPIYLYNTFKNVGCESNLWDTNVHSAYDILDMTSPDVLFMRWDCKRKNDVIKYVTQNQKSPDLAVNVTNAPEEVINEFKYLNKCRLLFTNDYDEPTENIKKVWLVMPCVDIFLPTHPAPDYLVDAAICSEQSINVENKFESYHTLCFNMVNNESADLTVNLYSLASIYHKYKQFILSGDLKFIFSQIFFDAIIRSNRVVINNKKEDNDQAKKIIEKIFYFDTDNNIEEKIKFDIKTKHTCLNRAQQLFSILGNSQAVSILAKEIEKII